MKRVKKEKASKRIRKNLFLLFLGCMIGVHRNVIKSLINGEPMPEAPEWHFWVKK